MANKTVEALIKCPFYEQESENRIVCEGYIKDTCMITKFSGAAQKKAHLRACCFREDGGACFFAQSLFKKYEAEDA